MREKRISAAVLITLLALAATGVCALLALLAYSLAPALGCAAVDGGLSCDDALASPWATWLGVPVSVLGGAVYALIIVACWAAALRPSGLALGALLFASLTALGAGAWFVWVQVVEMRGFCVYCTAVHACGLLITLLSLYLARNAGDQAPLRSLLVATAPRGQTLRARPARSRWPAVIGCLLAAISVGVLAAGQVLAPGAASPGLREVATTAAPPDASAVGPPDEEHDTAPTDSQPPPAATAAQDALPPLEPPPPARVDRRLRFEALAAPVRVDSMPVLGSVGAAHVIVEALDYTCRHCRELHPYMKRALEARSDELAVVIYHAPLNSDCNPNIEPGRRQPANVRYACDYAQLAIGVWLLSPDDFPAFHDWLMEGDEPPRITEARKHAAAITDDEILLSGDVRAQCARRINRQCAALAGLTGGLPALIFEHAVAHGVPTDDDQLAELLSAKLGLGPDRDLPGHGPGGMPEFP